jgi:hypothetical protein
MMVEAQLTTAVAGCCKEVVHVTQRMSLGLLQGQ